MLDMSGLNIITDAILDKAKADAESILKQAEEKRAELINEAKKEAEQECEKIMLATEERIKNIEAAAKSSAEQKLSRELLKKKAELIKEVSEAAKMRVYSMNDEEYNEILLKLLAKYAQKGKSGEIAFAEKDKTRISQKLAKEMEQAGLEISDTCENIKGGFILKYGKIEENCSIEAIFHDRQEEITDFLNRELFV